jgi:hypothetical protein
MVREQLDEREWSKIAAVVQAQRGRAGPFSTGRWPITSPCLPVQQAHDSTLVAGDRVQSAGGRGTVASRRAIVAGDLAKFARDLANAANDFALVAGGFGLVAGDFALVASDFALVSGDRVQSAGGRGTVASRRAIVARMLDSFPTGTPTFAHRCAFAKEHGVPRWIVPRARGPLRPTDRFVRSILGVACHPVSRQEPACLVPSPEAAAKGAADLGRAGRRVSGGRVGQLQAFAASPRR